MQPTRHRVSKGSRLHDAFPTPTPLPSLTTIDSAFQIQEYISLLLRQDIHDVESIVNIPTRKESSDLTVAPEANYVSDAGGSEDASHATGSNEEEKLVDEACWVYEHLRRVAQDLAHPLLSSLQMECTRSTCPEMKADEWLYLCVAHGTGGSASESRDSNSPSASSSLIHQCCAIDYIIHTLDSATALLNSPKAFPSRISIPAASRRHFLSLARRLSRIFAHAYYAHRETFEQAEAESSLYARFYLLSIKFDLVPPEFLIAPPTSSNSSFNQSSSSHPESEDDDADFKRQSLPRPDAGASSSTQSQDYSTEDSNGKSPLMRSRTDTMYLSSESLEMALNAEKAKWASQKAEEEAAKNQQPTADLEEEYDIVEAAPSSLRGGTSAPLLHPESDPAAPTDERLIVDEVDGAGEGLPAVDPSLSPADADVAEAVEAAAALPVLGSQGSDISETLGVLSPASSTTLSRSPRRDTIRAPTSPKPPALELEPATVTSDPEEEGEEEEDGGYGSDEGKSETVRPLSPVAGAMDGHEEAQAEAGDGEETKSGEKHESKDEESSSPTPAS